MESGDILQVLSEYDTTAQIKVTISFDSDEENSSTINNKNTAPETTVAIADNSDELTRPNPDVVEESLLFQNVSKEENAKINAKKRRQSKLQIYKNKMAKINNNKSIKDTHSPITEKPTTEVIPAIVNLNIEALEKTIAAIDTELKCETNLAEPQNITNVPNSTALTDQITCNVLADQSSAIPNTFIISKITSQKEVVNTCTNNICNNENKTKEISLNINKAQNDNTGCNYSVATYPHKNNDSYEMQINNKSETENDVYKKYIRKSMSSVAEHMRLIMEAYDHHKIFKTPPENFRQFKLHYFSLSYSTMSTIIIPGENNPTFVKAFIDFTLHHVRNVSPGLCKRYFYSDFATLFEEILKWTKQKQNYITFHNQSTRKRNEQLINNAAVNPLTINSTNPNSATTSEQSLAAKLQNKTHNGNTRSICIFSAGPSGSEVSITFDPTVTSQNVQSIPKQHTPVKKPSVCENIREKPAKALENKRGNNSTVHSQTQKQFTLTNSNAPNNVHESSFARLLGNPSAPPPYYGVPHFMQNSQEPSQQVISQQQQNQEQVRCSQLQQANKNIYKHPQLGKSNNLQKTYNDYVCPRNMQALNTQQYNMQQQHLTKTPQQLLNVPIQQPPPPQLHRTFSNVQLMHQISHMQAQSPVQLEKESPRSSVSTDSGFVSPLNMDLMISPLTEDQTTCFTPLITHVTSLNPAAAHINEGKCCVCSKRTNQACMGCLKLYYCSYNCQVSDWASHGPNCIRTVNSQKTSLPKQPVI